MARMLPTKERETNFSWFDLGKAMWFLLKGQRKTYLFFTVVLILVFFWTVVPAFVVGKIVDFFTHYHAGGPLLPFYGYVAFLGIMTAIIALIRLSAKNSLSKIQSRVTYFTRVQGFERLLDFSITWHDKENSGNKVQKIQNGTNALSQLQQSLSGDIYFNITVIIGVLIAYTFLNPLFLLISLAYLVIFMIVQVSFYKTMLRLNDEYYALMEQASGVYYEGISNVLTLKTLGVKDDFKKNITSKEELTREQSIQMTKLGTDKWKAFQIVNAAFLIIVLFLIGRDFIAGAITLGSIFVFYNYFSNLQNAIGSSTNLIDSLVSNKASIARMMPIYWEKLPVTQGKEHFPKDWKEIQIINGEFDYTQSDQSKEAALKNISLTIHKHEKIGIVGKSGSGKSTFAKILLGLYELHSGKFTIGGKNFYSIRHNEITGNIALILQESEMFNLSFQDNITLMREFNEKLFQKAISIAQLDDLIASLPDGINTMIGEKGYRLSGGERQRIGIARAIYKDPEILVMDEATSSLDTKTETLIQQAMEKELQKKTLIIIAHRVSTLKNVDKIYVFKDGMIAEEGTFDKLANNKNSLFYDISHYKREK